MALNLSINGGETRYYNSNLDKTSLCDCFSYPLKRARHLQKTAALDENKAVTETTSQSVSQPEAQDPEEEDEEMDLDIDREREYDQNINTFCHCVTVPIQHRKFKLFRIDLLFDPREYAQIIGPEPGSIPEPGPHALPQTNSDRLVAINVLLHDHESRIWSGVQMANIQIKNGFLLIPRLSLQCNQTLINKSVSIVGSMAWRILDEATENEADSVPKWYPYRQCTISQMISVLTQQRYDIVDSYDAVIQQRSSAQNKGDDATGDEKGNGNKRNALNRVVPKREKLDQGLDPEDIFSDEQEAEQKPLTEDTEPEENGKEQMEEVQVAQRLYPVAHPDAYPVAHPVAHPVVQHVVQHMAQRDGGSNIPTKREEVHGIKQEILPHGQPIGKESQHRGQKNALLTTASSSKHPGILVEEMEKHMLNEEVARIESMIMGLETAVAAIEEKGNTVGPHFDEMTESVSSSMMFNTKELNRARSKIADHLSTGHGVDEILPLVPNQRVERPPHEVVNARTHVNGMEKKTAMTTVPVCLSCQRCSRTIMLCQRNQ